MPDAQKPMKLQNISDTRLNGYTEPAFSTETVICFHQQAELKIPAEENLCGLSLFMGFYICFPSGNS